MVIQKIVAHTCISFDCTYLILCGGLSDVCQAFRRIHVISVAGGLCLAYGNLENIVAILLTSLHAKGTGHVSFTTACSTPVIKRFRCSDIHSQVASLRISSLFSLRPERMFLIRRTGDGFGPGLFSYYPYPCSCSRICCSPARHPSPPLGCPSDTRRWSL